MTNHLNEMQRMMNQLATMKMVLKDEFHALLLLSSFLDSYETLVVTHTNSTPNRVVTMSIIKASLLKNKTRRKNIGSFINSYIG